LREKVGSQSTFSWFNLVTDMEKPTSRGPSASRKAHHALGKILNRKTKRPPRLPAKEIGATVNRASTP